MNLSVGKVRLTASRHECLQIFGRVFWWSYFDLDLMPGVFAGWIRSLEADRIVRPLFLSDGFECQIYTLASGRKKNLSTAERRQLLKPALVHYKGVVFVGIRLTEKSTYYIDK